MKNKRPSIDGFIPRRTGNQLGEHHMYKEFKDVDKERSNLHTGNEASSQLGSARGDMLLGRLDLEESLNQIDESSDDRKLSKRQERKALKSAKRPGKLRRIIKWLVIIILVAGLGFGAYYATRIFLAGGNVFNGSILDLIQNQPLKQDSNGRSNFLILGTSEDDPGHLGGTLTDSIMVISIDQKNKNAYIFNVPRDLDVQYGEACLPGYSGKVNAYFACADDGTSKEAEQNRLAKTQKLIGDIFGIDIQYGVHVNYTVMRDVVNAIGGSINITIESRDPRGQMDANFDWKCGASYYQRVKNCPPDGHYIQYPNGQVTLDAEHALYLAQARGDVENYGFSQSNFDREKNQQKILLAIRGKALTVGTLSNINTITNLVEALGNNLRTNIQTKEIRTIMNVASTLKSEDIHTLSLIDGDSPVMDGTGNPSAGTYSYSAIRAFIKKSLSSNAVVREGAQIAVLNGSSVGGAAQAEADKLEAKDFNVTTTGNARQGSYDAYEIYILDSTKTATLDALKAIYPNATIKTTTPPGSFKTGTSFVLVIGG